MCDAMPAMLEVWTTSCFLFCHGCFRFIPRGAATSRFEWCSLPGFSKALGAIRIQLVRSCFFCHRPWMLPFSWAQHVASGVQQLRAVGTVGLCVCSCLAKDSSTPVP